MFVSTFLRLAHERRHLLMREVSKSEKIIELVGKSGRNLLFRHRSVAKINSGLPNDFYIVKYV